MKKRFETMKRAAVVTLPVAVTAANAITSFASETGSTSLADTTTSVMTSAVTELASSVANAISAVIPIALPLVGASLVVTIGLKVFTKITNKA